MEKNTRHKAEYGRREDLPPRHRERDWPFLPRLAAVQTREPWGLERASRKGVGKAWAARGAWAARMVVGGMLD